LQINPDYAVAYDNMGNLELIEGNLAEAEDYFNKRGKISTFIGRLIPGIRQLISIPAGLCRMHFGWFLFYTFLGAGIWNGVLALLGILAEGQKEKIEEYSHEVSIVLMAGFGILVLYFISKHLSNAERSRLNVDTHDYI
jgi:membrane protein DedA with SNARE-associated domain